MSNSDAGLDIKTVMADGAPVIHVAGEVDLRTSPRLRVQLLEAAGKAQGPFLVDLSGVSYMDSSGVGTMVFVKRELERGGRRLVLIGLQSRVRSVLEITHLDKFFTIVPSINEAPR